MKNKMIERGIARTFQTRFAMIAALGCIAIVLSPLQSPVAHGQTYTTLLTFNYLDGCGPGDLTLSGTTLYGMTNSGGAYENGTVFSIATSGGAPTTLLSFSDTTGEWPDGGLTLNGATLYGMTSHAGAFTTGTLFSIATSGGAPTTLHSFNSYVDGADPAGNLTLSGTTLYGMTAYSVGGYGTIFSIATTGGTLRTLLSFSGTNGEYPQGDLTLSGTRLYGMTSSGGAYDDGTIFSIATTGGPLTTLLSFSGSNGGVPFGDLTLGANGSTLYGATALGGTYNDGTIFSIATTGGPLTTLLSFSGLGGATPGNYPGDLTLSADGSTMYGTTGGGGPNDWGTVFSLSVPEPSTIALLGVGGVALLGHAWRRRRRAV